MCEFTPTVVMYKLISHQNRIENTLYTLYLYTYKFKHDFIFPYKNRRTHVQKK